MNLLFMQLLPTQQQQFQNPLPQQTLPQVPQAAPGAGAKEQLLAQLHDVIAPGTVSWWPLAIGWWIAAVIVLILLVTGILWLRARIHGNKYRQHAKALIKQLPTDDSQTIAQYAQSVTTILKRCYFTAYPIHKNRAASSYGEQWQALLSESLPAKQTFIKIPWSDLIYTNIDTGFSKKNIKEFALMWINKHSRHAALSSSHREKTTPNKQGAEHVSV